VGFGRGALLWLLGIPLPIILLLALFCITEQSQAKIRKPRVMRGFFAYLNMR
jgi:hypothetical protein